jgi:hypothetical protein
MQLFSAESARTLRHTAVAAAMGAGLMMASAASFAQVINSGPVSLAVPLSTNGLYLNVLTGANNLPPPGTGGATVPGWDINPYSTTGLSFFSATPAASSGYASAAAGLNQPVGATIGASSTFLTAIQTPAVSTWNLNSSSNFVGFRFLNEGATASTTDDTIHYGYFQLRLGANVLDRTLVSYAFNATPGASITVVPEPGTYALMGLGLAGLMLVARRRKQD